MRSVIGRRVQPALQRQDIVAAVAAAGSGDKLTTERLVAYFLPDIKAYAKRRGAIHAEELANLAVAEFVLALPRLQFSTPEQVWAYLYRVATSRIQDERRRPSREDPTGNIEVADPGGNEFDGGIVDQLWLADVLSSLPEDQRQVVELRFREDLSLAETAERTGKTLTAVKGLQRRALASLATACLLYTSPSPRDRG